MPDNHDRLAASVQTLSTIRYVAAAEGDEPVVEAGGGVGHRLGGFLGYPVVHVDVGKECVGVGIFGADFGKIYARGSGDGLPVDLASAYHHDFFGATL